MPNKNYLVIVESPAKAKTIQKYLGSGYTVRSSFGHIRDLPKSGLSIDKEHGFAPAYQISPEKRKTITELKKFTKSADEVILASDEDREGEAIAWHLCEALKLDPKTTKRIVFHEITKSAIEDALKTPRTVDMDLVNAQQARRVLDRLVGYELSPVLWKKVKAGLSAGRVQSVAVRLIVEREREITAFNSSSSFKVTAIFLVDGVELKAEIPKKFDSVEVAETFLQSCVGADFSVLDLQTKPGTRTPGAPFTTSTLQQEASRRLGYGVKYTMQLAQKLYENGHITYMRTDSTNLSGLAINAAKDHITGKYGAQYSQVRQFKTKNESAQEAHEAIRPTNFAVASAGDEGPQQKLYELIWRRALASQMTPAKIDKTEMTIGKTKTDKTPFIATGEVITFDGFLKVYGGGKDDVILPAVTVGQNLELASVQAREVFSKPPARYSEASLVKAMEEMGIGRPSTYAPTISTIQDRGYIEKRELEGNERTVRVLTLKKQTVEQNEETERYGADKGKLVPTHLADMVTDFLLKYFGPIIDYDFTANVEREFDEIADGKQVWNKMIAEFYEKRFVPLVKDSDQASRAESSQMRELGVEPKSGKIIYARYGRYGAMLQLGEASEDKSIKVQFAPLPEGTTLDTVTFERAVKMFDLPRLVGTTESGEEIKANIGRFGPYVVVGKTFVSIKPLDPLTITETEARELIREKQTKDANKYINEFEGGIKVVNGLYGPYITDGKKNAKIPKDVEPASLTLEQCKEYLEKAPARGKGRGRFTKRKPSSKK